MNLERTPTSRTMRARYAPLLGRLCVFILIYLQYILYSTKYTFSRYIQQKVDSCESRRDEEPFREKSKLCFPPNFLLDPSSIRATPIAHTHAYRYLSSYKSILQYIYKKKKKNIWLSKPSLIVAIVRLLLLLFFFNDRYPLMLRR